MCEEEEELEQTIRTKGALCLGISMCQLERFKVHLKDVEFFTICWMPYYRHAEEYVCLPICHTDLYDITSEVHPGSSSLFPPQPSRSSLASPALEHIQPLTFNP
ncbi:unnamed protein product [Lota lota]